MPCIGRLRVMPSLRVVVALLVVIREVIPASLRVLITTSVLIRVEAFPLVVIRIIRRLVRRRRKVH